MLKHQQKNAKTNNPLKNYHKKKSFFILFGLILNIHMIRSQVNDVNTYNWFDNTIGKENLDIINGVPHTNPYKTAKESINLYYINAYELGNLTYDGQIYYNVNLKYDIFRDILVLSPSDQAQNIGINIIKNKVKSFSIKDINFVNINNQNNKDLKLSNGYYEENKHYPYFTFYIKHYKDQQKITNDEGIFYLYKESPSYFIDLKNTVYHIKSKNDLIKLFPEQKKQISEFYLMNRELKKTNSNLFMRNLMKYISNSLTIQTI